MTKSEPCVAAKEWRIGCKFVKTILLGFCEGTRPVALETPQKNDQISRFGAELLDGASDDEKASGVWAYGTRHIKYD